MKNFIYCSIVLLLAACGSNPNAKYEKNINELNAITKGNCAPGASFVFKAADGTLTINYNKSNSPAECSAKLADLIFEINTLEGEESTGMDHEVVIKCKSEDGKCFSGNAGTFGKIKIELKGEKNADALVENLTAIQGL